MTKEVWSISKNRDSKNLALGCETRDEAVASGRVLYGTGQSFWVFRCELPDPAGFLPPVDNIFDEMAANALDGCGECVGDWPEPTDEAKRELVSMLEYWARKNAKPTFWVPVEEPELIEAAND